MTKRPHLSIIITTSSDARVIHKTLLSVKLAISRTTQLAEVILLYNERSKEVATYLSVNSSLFTDETFTLVPTHRTTSQDQKRQGIELSNGTHLLFVHAGDLISPDYISNSLKKLASNKDAVAIPEATIVFYDLPGHAPRIELTRLPSKTDQLLQSIYPRLYGKSAIYPRSFFKRYTLPDEKPGQSHYYWHMLCNFMHLGGRVELVSDTCQYIRKEKPNSYGQESPFVLPASLSYKPSFIQSLEEPSWVQENLHKDDSLRTRKDRIKNSLHSYPVLIKLAQNTLHLHSKFRSTAHRIIQTRKADIADSVPSWLFDETLLEHQIESRVFIHPNSSKHHNVFTSPKEQIIASCSAAYKISCNYLRHDNYDYIIVVPWLIAGGADMFFMNYANTIATLRKNKNVLVISTEQAGKSLERSHLRLNESVDFLPLAEILRHDKHYQSLCTKLLGLLIESTGAQVLHVANSLLGYQFMIEYSEYLTARGTKLVATGYNEIINNEGQRQGYVHEHIPLCYDKLNLITTDNQRIIDIWREEYGFDTSRALLHHQPFRLPESTKTPSEFTHNGLRVLWASHVRKEKGPDMVIEVAKYFNQTNKPVTFDCYGAVDKFHYPINPFHGASANLSYKGAFKNFFKDINIHDYDVFLYTSLFDGTPNIVIEAGLGKLPIITSAIGGIPELVKSDATLVQQPTSPEEFIQALEGMLADKKPFIEKADSLHQRLAKNHTFPAFEKEIDQMLSSLDY